MTFIILVAAAFIAAVLIRPALGLSAFFLLFLWFAPIKIAGYSPRIAMLLLIAVAVLPQIIRREIEFSPQGKHLLILLLLLPLSALPTLMLKSVEPSYHFFRMVSFVVVVPLIINVVQDEARLRLMVTILVLGSLVSCIFVYLQAMFGEEFYEIHYRMGGQYYALIEGLPKYLRDNRPFGLSSHSIDFGYDTLLIYGLLFAHLKCSDYAVTHFRKHWILLMFVFMTGALVLNITRSVLLSLFLLFPISQLIFEREQTLNNLAYFLSLTAFAISSIIIFDVNYERLISVEDTSLTGRVGLYLAGLSSILEHPFLGLGPDDATLFSRLFSAARMPAEYVASLDISAVHNNYMNAYLSYGGLFFFTLIIVTAKTLFMLWRNYQCCKNSYPSVVSAGLLIGIILYMINIFFHNGGTFTHAFFWVFPGIALAIDCMNQKKMTLREE